MTPTTRTPLVRLLVALAAPLALAACGDEPVDENETYEAGVEDVSGGELIVTDPATKGIEDLELPETPMTPVPPGAGGTATPAANPTASPTAE